MTGQELTEKRNRIDSLRALMAEDNDMLANLELAEEIHQIEMEIKGVKPTNSQFDCEGCGA
jgi:hypothetical protein